jgi:RimJ/RimL family protein N-acetyltransferase
MWHTGIGPAMPESDRFAFRLFTEDDLDDLRLLHGTDTGMRYMSVDGKAWDDEQLLWWVRHWREEYAAVGSTKFRVERTSDGRFIGRAGVSPLDDDDTVGEIGYALIASEWGKGYATALATIVRDWYFAVTDRPVLIGMTRVGNAASQAVLRKIGMVPDGRGVHYGGPVDMFHLDRPQVTQATRS